jgi:hypothetical protein
MELGKIYRAFEANTNGDIIDDTKFDYVIAMFQHHGHTHVLNVSKLIFGYDTNRGWVKNVDDNHPVHEVDSNIKQYIASIGKQVIPQVFMWSRD